MFRGRLLVIKPNLESPNYFNLGHKRNSFPLSLYSASVSPKSTWAEAEVRRTRSSGIRAKCPHETWKWSLFVYLSIDTLTEVSEDTQELEQRMKKNTCFQLMGFLKYSELIFFKNPLIVVTSMLRWDFLRFVNALPPINMGYMKVIVMVLFEQICSIERVSPRK